MDFIARFAPSPTGQVHIGNIRTAIFNWLFARHQGGQFLLRIEDTDLERSTREAIDTLLACMDWLGLDYDGIPMYQTKQLPSHLEAAKKLFDAGHAYRLDPADEHSPVLFRIPYDCGDFPFVRDAGQGEIDLVPDSSVSVARNGLSFQTLSAKGKTVDNQYCLAGFHNLKILNAEGKILYALNEVTVLTALTAVDPIVVEHAAKLVFDRREVFYHDLVKGDLAKPLDSIRDFIIIRSDGSPVFHLANVRDDIEQGVTHIVRGDDHVENTYRHLFLFQLLGAKPPVYAHLPMIVNAQGKPYSKRDGDAFVGDFKEKGILPEALFNYLSLLGWSPGDNREKMSKKELIEAFHIEKAQHSPAQFDSAKLANMNGLYLAELDPSKFADMAWDFAARYPWREQTNRKTFDEVAALMQSRTKLLTDLAGWTYFFTADYPLDAKAVKKNLGNPAVNAALAALADSLEAIPAYDFTPKAVEEALRSAEATSGLKEFALNQPLRVAATGVGIGAGMYETAVILGAAETASRVRRTLEKQTGVTA